MKIGSEVGLATDHARRGVIVDSHPERGWRVWLNWWEEVRWFRSEDLWERPISPHDALQAEVERLTAWLARIDGGDVPCEDAALLRRWAYEGLTLRREVPVDR